MRTPYQTPDVYRARRGKLAALMPGAALVLPSWPEQYRNADGDFKYRAESNLLYLTGFDEPECCLIFRPGAVPETTMFVREKDPARETWTGFRYGPEAAREMFGFDQAYPIAELEARAPELLRGFGVVYHTLFRNREFDEKFARIALAINGWRPRFGRGLPAIADAQALVGEMRLVKGADEIALMRRAAEITALGHVAMMRATRPGVTERALHGVFLAAIAGAGAMGEAYNGIVATGRNATTLHYVFNESSLKVGESVLVDCGAEFGFYAGDITRCWPVSGKFTPAQRRVYDRLLELQIKLIEMCRPGLAHAELQKATVAGVAGILVDEGVVSGSVGQIVADQGYQRYYMHGVSHLLGLDTHDAGTTVTSAGSREMAAGWVITIEPGIYFPADDPAVPADLRGFGLRIEDDVLITGTGHEVLTAGVPKDVESIERLVGADFRGEARTS